MNIKQNISKITAAFFLSLIFLCPSCKTDTENSNTNIHSETREENEAEKDNPEETEPANDSKMQISIDVNPKVPTRENIKVSVTAKSKTRIKTVKFKTQRIIEQEARENPSDNSKWDFTILPHYNNGIYTITIEDESGNTETREISIKLFDFAEPEEFKVDFKFNSNEKTITATWKDPKDAYEDSEEQTASGFKDMTVSYKKKNDENEPKTETIPPETEVFTTSVLEENQIYEFVFTAQDNVGNSRSAVYNNKSSVSLNFIVGDVFLADGTNVNIDEYTAIDKENPPVAIVAAKLENGETMGIGLQQISRKVWAERFANEKARNELKELPGYSVFEKIICKPTPIEPQTIYNKGRYTEPFSGDLDGSDNWEEICKADPTAEENAEKNYPAFYWANSYGATYKDKLGKMTENWYIPSVFELFSICKNEKQISAALKRINELDKEYSPYNRFLGSWWTSSQRETYGNYTFTVSGGSSYDSIIFEQAKEARDGVLVVRKF